jgi:hypothetical protein
MNRTALSPVLLNGGGHLQMPEYMKKYRLPRPS